MSVRLIVAFAVVGAAVGTLLTLATWNQLLPTAVNYLTLPGVALVWGTSAGVGAIVAVNASIYGLGGLLVGAGLALAKWRHERFSSGGLTRS